MVAATEIIARAVVRRGADVLLVRMVGAAWYFLPGGHVEVGEGVEAAMVREIAEELGATAEVAGFVGVVEYGYTHEGVEYRELNFVFEVTLDDPEPASREDHLEFVWFPVDRLADTDVRPPALRDALAHGAATPFWRAWHG